MPATQFSRRGSKPPAAVSLLYLVSRAYEDLQRMPLLGMAPKKTPPTAASIMM
ncbi:hypothetical protein DFS28_12051 [Pseudomonas sp. 478]|nr:hypothetical protein DFS28_12051 [Pseudomonas sp. 478]TCV39186.1 hypothetical protein EDB99_13317 [Pseudomonas sp. 460]